MAVEGVKNNAMAVVLQQANQNQMREIAMPSAQVAQANNEQSDRVTISSRQNDVQGVTNQTRNLAMSATGQSQRPTGANADNTVNNNNNNLVAQLISEAANRTASLQQANAAYNPNKPTQTQNQINYTV